MHYSVLADGMCDPIPAVLHAVPSTTQAKNGTTVVYTCEPGFTFSNGMATSNAICNGAVWSAVDNSCEGSFVWFVKFYNNFQVA
jgi:hypothetical protein